MFMLLIGMLVACKKENEILSDELAMEPTKDVAIWAELEGAPDKLLEGTEFKVYVQSGGKSDTSYAFTAYSGANGKAYATLLKQQYYCVVATTRTYKSTYESNTHYYKKTFYFSGSDYLNSDTFNSAVLSPYFVYGDKKVGTGCTSEVFADPQE